MSDPGAAAPGAGPSGRPAVLVVAPWVYHPGCGIGGGVLCFEVLRRLAEHYELHWLSFEDTVNDLEGGKAALAGVCQSIRTVALPHRRFKLLWLKQALGGPPFEAEFARSDELRAAIGEICQARAIDLVLLQFPEMAQYADAAPKGVPTVIDVQDVWTVSRFRRLQTTSGWMRFNRFLNWLAWARHELRHYGRADALLALSENDAGVLRSFLPSTRVVLSPVATAIGPAVDVAAGRQVLMLGNYKHHPNADGLRWMLAEAWPLVRRAVPDARLAIVGPGWTAAADEAAEGIETLGFVDDLGPVFAAARMAVVPYRFGGGVKIKALEAMAHGCPVVATSVGAEGLGAAEGEAILVADDAAAFAAQIVCLLQDPARAARLGEAGRAHVAAQFSFEAKTAGLRRLFDQLAAARR